MAETIALTHCENCGAPFTEPVPVAQALHDFPDLDVAAYDCSWCAEDSEEEA